MIERPCDGWAGRLTGGGGMTGRRGQMVGQAPGGCPYTTEGDGLLASVQDHAGRGGLDSGLRRNDGGRAFRLFGQQLTNDTGNERHRNAPSIGVRSSFDKLRMSGLPCHRGMIERPRDGWAGRLTGGGGMTGRRGQMVGQAPGGWPCATEGDGLLASVQDHAGCG